MQDRSAGCKKTACPSLDINEKRRMPDKMFSGGQAARTGERFSDPKNMLFRKTTAHVVNGFKTTAKTVNSRGAREKKKCMSHFPEEIRTICSPKLCKEKQPLREENSLLSRNRIRRQYKLPPSVSGLGEIALSCLHRYLCAP